VREIEAHAVLGAQALELSDEPAAKRMQLHRMTVW